MRPRRKTKHYFYDEQLTIRIKDRRGRVVLVLPAQTAREYDAAMRRLQRMNRAAECAGILRDAAKGRSSG